VAALGVGGRVCKGTPVGDHAIASSTYALERHAAPLCIGWNIFNLTRFEGGIYSSAVDVYCPLACEGSRDTGYPAVIVETDGTNVPKQTVASAGPHEPLHIALAATRIE
jgi:ribosomal protein S12 methylthiotransferase accessory factor YcaO